MRLSLVLAIVLSIPACGNDDAAGDPDAACAPVPDGAPFPDAIPPDPSCAGAKCGGDVAGDWQFVAACAVGTGDGSFFGCSEGSVIFGNFHVSGIVHIAADGTLTSDLDENATGRATLPLSCYALDRCTQLEALAEAANSAVSATCQALGPLDGSCQVVDESCECDIAVVDPHAMLNATITTDPVAGTFSLTMGDETVTGEYCADSEALWLHFIRFGGVDYRYRLERAMMP